MAHCLKASLSSLSGAVPAVSHVGLECGHAAAGLYWSLCWEKHMNVSEAQRLEGGRVVEKADSATLTLKKRFALLCPRVGLGHVWNSISRDWRMSFVMVSHLDTCAHTPPTHTYTGAWVPSNRIQAYMPPPPQTSLPSFFNVQTCCWWCCPGNEFKAICYDDSCRSGVSVRGCMVDQDGAAAEILPICQMGGLWGWGILVGHTL